VVVVNYNNHCAEHVWLTSAVLNVLSAVCYGGMYTVIFAHFGVLPFRDGKVNIYHALCTCMDVCVYVRAHFKFQTC
jgi:hypothetical protein